MHRIIEDTWRKSSYSNDIGQCVEVAPAEEAVGVRDTKDRAGGTLTITPRAWAAFTAALKADGFGR